MAVDSIDQVKAIFRNHGVRTVYVKRLAPKQDNEKNQVLLGYSPTGLAALFPGKITLGSPSESKKKRNSRPGAPKTEVRLDFYWIDPQDELAHAPNAKLIDYLQYPETRFSGFLQGAKWGPDAIRRDKQAEFGQRIFLIGSTSDGKVLGLLLSERNDPVVADFPELPGSSVSTVLGVLSTELSDLTSPAEVLADRIRKIVSEGWHTSVRNKGGEIIPFKGNQGAGYTFEALLGVETNASKEPDILGHEVKTYRGSKLSLMTPTADQGPEGDLSFRDFMDRYGTPAAKNDGSIRFTGLVRAGKVSSARGLSLRVAGYDVESDHWERPENIRVEQYVVETGEVVSAWSLEKLTESWGKKHAFAVYVSAEKSEAQGGDLYRFKSPFFMCEGTDVLRLLRAIATGHVYYDPAHTIYESGEAKVRPQWRVNTTKFRDTLELLYQNVREVQ